MKALCLQLNVRKKGGMIEIQLKWPTKGSIICCKGTFEWNELNVKIKNKEC